MVIGARVEQHQGMYHHQQPGVELVDNLNPNQVVNELIEGIVEDATTYPPDKEKLIQVNVSGLSLSGKTTVIAQLGVEIERHPKIINWEAKTGRKISYLHSSLGSRIYLARKLGLVSSADGNLIDIEYEYSNEIGATLDGLVGRYIPGPAIYFEEGVYVTEIVAKNGDYIGTPRGSFRFLHKRLRTDSLSRCVLLLATDEIRDQEAPLREQMRTAEKTDRRKLLRNSKIVVDKNVSDEMLQDFYTRTGNQKARFAQEEDLRQVVFHLLMENAFPYDYHQFPTYSYEEFSDYTQNNPEEWFRFLSGPFSREWMTRLFGGEYNHHGFTLVNRKLEEGSKRHVYVNKLKEMEVVPNLIRIAFDPQKPNLPLQNALRQLNVITP